ncbi:hypothetical protein [Photobacterium sanctipauli]|nr:hypothetical protein [Photobacterium sanctipauli]
MKNLPIALMLVALAGCADKAVNTKGSEALIYQQVHTLDLQIKQRSTKAAKQQIDDLINQLYQEQQTLEWQTVYYSRQGKALAGYLKSKLISQGVAPQNVTAIAASQGNSATLSDITITVNAYRLLIEHCPTMGFGIWDMPEGCYTEGNRINQVSDPKRLRH